MEAHTIQWPKKKKTGTHRKPTDWATQTQLKTGSELKCSGRVGPKGARLIKVDFIS
jgi:hypothetical protein